MFPELATFRHTRPTLERETSGPYREQGGVGERTGPERDAEKNSRKTGKQPFGKTKNSLEKEIAPVKKHAQKGRTRRSDAAGGFFSAKRPKSHDRGSEGGEKVRTDCDDKVNVRQTVRKRLSRPMAAQIYDQGEKIGRRRKINAGPNIGHDRKGRIIWPNGADVGVGKKNQYPLELEEVSRGSTSACQSVPDCAKEGEEIYQTQKVE